MIVKAEAIEADLPTVSGRREQNKTDKLRRIKDSARSEFLARGFDRASTRDIASAAGVAHATVFLYAQDKRDLLFLVFGDELSALMQRCIELTDPSAPLVDRLVERYCAYLHFFSTGVPFDLLSLYQRSGIEASRSSHGSRILRMSASAQRHLKSIIEEAIRSGEVDPCVDVALTARVIRSIFFTELELWLIASPRCGLEKGAEDVRLALSLLMRGLAPKAQTSQPDLQRRRQLGRRVDATSPPVPR